MLWRLIMMETRSPQSIEEWNDYFDLRYRILRTPLNQTLGSERDDGDVSGIHFALYENQVLLAIARLDYSNTKVAQVRFVAVEENQQGRGIGRKIMEAVENRCISDGKEKLILHARDYALDFYLKLGYVNIEKSYKLFGVLQHFLMEKHF